MGGVGGGGGGKLSSGSHLILGIVFSNVSFFLAVTLYTSASSQQLFQHLSPVQIRLNQTQRRPDWHIPLSFQCDIPLPAQQLELPPSNTLRADGLCFPTQSPSFPLLWSSCT